MDSIEIKNYNDWNSKSLQNGYLFKSEARLIPSPEDTFYWKPVKPSGERLEVEVYMKKDKDSYVYTGRNCRIFIPIHGVDLAIKVNEFNLSNF